jgi:hypothetical protein
MKDFADKITDREGLQDFTDIKASFFEDAFINMTIQ